MPKGIYCPNLPSAHALGQSTRSIDGADLSHVEGRRGGGGGGWHKASVSDCLRRGGCAKVPYSAAMERPSGQTRRAQCVIRRFCGVSSWIGPGTSHHIHCGDHGAHARGGRALGCRPEAPLGGGRGGDLGGAGGGGGFGTSPWWLALFACGGAYWPLALEPSAMTSRPPHYCRHPAAWGGNPECNFCPWQPPLTA